MARRLKKVFSLLLSLKSISLNKSQFIDLSAQDMRKRKSILFVGHCYYNNYYLSRELRNLGWRADVINIDSDPNSQMYYHGSDYNSHGSSLLGMIKDLVFYIKALFKYNIFHFSNSEGFLFPPFNHGVLQRIFGRYFEVRFLKMIGKILTYSNNGCRDGVLQSSFNKWGPNPVCDICAWQHQPDVCSDKKNAEWGILRNRYADFVGILGSNRVDYNKSSICHEAPWLYSLDKNFWNPELLIPSNYLLPFSNSTVKIYHSVGNYDSRSSGPKKQTIKCTHIWIEVIERLKSEGIDVELIFFTDVPNKILRYYQAQADIFVDMLTYGFFGANVREAMMLGKPAICFLRPEWLADMAQEYPSYVEELPIVSATPETAYSSLKELVLDAQKRRKLGQCMRDFGVKWHASDISAHRADSVFSKYLNLG